MKSIEETLTGIVTRVTYHNVQNGWSVLRIQPLDNPAQQETVTVHQTKVFAGATMVFNGAWIINQQYGRQFQAVKAIEKKPATVAAIEKYLGSGLIKGVGPKTAKKIVKHFSTDTLDIFESNIERLIEVPGIAHLKLKMIETAWVEHRSIREVMMFLQGHGISTLFAVRIYKEYGDQAIDVVKKDPYKLAQDIYGIGFFSADKIALSLGFTENCQSRIIAAIKHVLAASRDQGHCFLTMQQIDFAIQELISLHLEDRLPHELNVMKENDQLRLRQLLVEGQEADCYYSKSLFYDELMVANFLVQHRQSRVIDKERIKRWIGAYCEKEAILLSEDQMRAVGGVVQHDFSVLTGGPGCGKTTTTKVIVKLLEAMGRKVLLAAPTGRAAQRMGEVIGQEAKTIHRLLVWKMGEFQVNEEAPLDADFLIVDECSMLDISLSAALLKGVPKECQVLFIGDADQLPSVGAGNVLKDIIGSASMPCYRLTTVFRQAKQSQIIQFAHQINRGKVPQIMSPFHSPSVWQNGSDCLFIDSDEATQAQLGFISRVKRYFAGREAGLQEQEEAVSINENLEEVAVGVKSNNEESPFAFREKERITSAYEKEFIVPEKFEHVDLSELTQASRAVEELKAVMRQVHPWSTLHYGLSAVEAVVKLYLEWIPKYHSDINEVQILTPMTRGSLGAANLNVVIQQNANPPSPSKCQIKVGERVFREGDRVIHRKNNYDLNVFNGDIGQILTIDTENVTCEVSFYPDSRLVTYQKEDIMELDLAYAITIHKSQGSEFQAVIIPIVSQHFNMLYRNLIYTALTRAKNLGVFVGSRRALSTAVGQHDTSLRQTALKVLISQPLTLSSRV